ncbi:MAG: formylglycine-generating enzyme family protein [Chloroflexi bacterium]|nr:formylglycine-generating enzyme family protein [Chloroflexota bacterium]
MTSAKTMVLVLISFGMLSCQAATTPVALPAEITDAKGLTMHLVPAGAFLMGSDDDKSGEAQPAHTVKLDNYYMDVYEVTRGRYKECVTAGACSESRNLAGIDSFYADPDYPMSAVDWNQSKVYCEAWRGARLPTEAEWEKAARGTDGRTYPWGEEYDSSYVKLEPDPNGDFLSKVGSYEKGKSPYGMYDMAGSVFEWTADSLTVYPGNQGDHSYYRDTDRVLRGGSWDHPDPYVLSTWFRFASFTGDNSGYTGFRCAKDAP